MASPRCSICGAAVDPERTAFMPFCSQRCHDIDLGRWLDERYGLDYESEGKGEATETEPGDAPD